MPNNTWNNDSGSVDPAHPKNAQQKVVIVIEDQDSMAPQDQAKQLSEKTGFAIVKASISGSNAINNSAQKKNKAKTKRLDKSSDKNIAPWQLVFTPTGLVLRMTFEPTWGDIKVDFESDALQYRKDKGGGKNEAIAKAIGIKSNANPTVIDCTAGMGNDSFVMASVGASVTMVERSPVIAALLADALYRSEHNDDVSHALKLVNQDATSYLLTQEQDCADVIYLDPMFPHKKKSALVKKEMRAFQMLLGADTDSEALLSTALNRAKHRVVVKRPSYADALANEQGRLPSMAITSKKHRFDVYLQH